MKLIIKWLFCFSKLIGEKIINDGIEALTRKSQARFQII